MAKKGKTESVQAREARAEAERTAAAQKAAAAQAAIDETNRLAEERKAAKAEKRKKTKRPRFVREVVAKQVAAKPKPQPQPQPGGSSRRGKLMTKNVALVPKDESGLSGNQTDFPQYR